MLHTVLSLFVQVCLIPATYASLETHESPATANVCQQNANTLLCSKSSGREAPGPYHGDDPHGSDPHDEVHDSDLPANQSRLPAKQDQDSYYKGGPHLPNSLASRTPDADSNEDSSSSKNAKNDQGNDEKNKQPARQNRKKRISDLIPTEPKPL